MLGEGFEVVPTLLLVVTPRRVITKYTSTAVVSKGFLRIQTLHICSYDTCYDVMSRPKIQFELYHFNSRLPL